MEPDEMKWEDIAKQLQKDLEVAQIKIATSMKPKGHLPDILGTLAGYWNNLTYMEKVYTIFLAIVGVFTVANQLHGILKHD
jgi:hypothetical protein